MSYCLGVDIGSITAKAVLLDSSNINEIVAWHIIPSGYDTKKTSVELVEYFAETKNIKLEDMKSIISTGYSRKNVVYATKQITEISCHARGIYHLFPEARTIIDIGGQDSKAIRIDENGKLVDFEMNDKCSAGTGRFLEVMARALEVDLKEMSEIGVKSTSSVAISSTCTVFAESEVVSRIAQGTDRESIIKGIHDSIATKTLALVGRIGITPEVVITGGVAKNKAVVIALEEKLGIKLKIPDEPQLSGALGAALLASAELKGK
ncbi:MAG: acyl-CoA dehydratase activase [Candidatus Hodarchaeales archaeon]